jgi:hypothetical protein
MSADTQRDATRRFRLDVANGNGIPGMAKKTRGVLEQHGIAGGHLSNQKPFNTATTEIQYRPGYLQEAERVRNALKAQVTLSVGKNMPGNADVRLLLGRDAHLQLALGEEPPKFVLNDK